MNTDMQVKVKNLMSQMRHSARSPAARDDSPDPYAMFRAEGRVDAMKADLVVKREQREKARIQAEKERKITEAEEKRRLQEALESRKRTNVYANLKKLQEIPGWDRLTDAERDAVTRKTQMVIVTNELEAVHDYGARVMIDDEFASREVERLLAKRREWTRDVRFERFDGGDLDAMSPYGNIRFTGSSSEEERAGKGRGKSSSSAGRGSEGDVASGGAGESGVAGVVLEGGGGPPERSSSSAVEPIPFGSIEEGGLVSPSLPDLTRSPDGSPKPKRQLQQESANALLIQHEWRKKARKKNRIQPSPDRGLPSSPDRLQSTPPDPG